MRAHIIIVAASVETELSFDSFIEVLRSYKWIKYDGVYTIHVVKTNSHELKGSCLFAVEGPGVTSYEELKPLPSGENILNMSTSSSSQQED